MSYQFNTLILIRLYKVKYTQSNHHGLPRSIGFPPPVIWLTYRRQGVQRTFGPTALRAPLMPHALTELTSPDINPSMPIWTLSHLHDSNARSFLIAHGLFVATTDETSALSSLRIDMRYALNSLIRIISCFWEILVGIPLSTVNNFSGAAECHVSAW